MPVFGCEYFPSKTNTCDMPIRAVRQTQTAGAITTPRAARPARGSAQTSTTTYDHCPFHKYVRTKMTKCRDIVLPAWLTQSPRCTQVGTSGLSQLVDQTLLGYLIQPSLLYHGCPHLERLQAQPDYFFFLKTAFFWPGFRAISVP